MALLLVSWDHLLENWFPVFFCEVVSVFITEVYLLYAAVISTWQSVCLCGGCLLFIYPLRALSSFWKCIDLFGEVEREEKGKGLSHLSGPYTCRFTEPVTSPPPWPLTASHSILRKADNLRFASLHGLSKSSPFVSTVDFSFPPVLH